MNMNTNREESKMTIINRIFCLCFEADTEKELEIFRWALGPDSLEDMLRIIEMYVKSLQLGNESASVNEFRRVVREKEILRRENERLKKKNENLKAEVERLLTRLALQE